jgi:hypothetical protein
MKIFIFLLFAHFIGDVFLRTKFINRHKAESISVMIFHCFIWSGCISIPLEVYGMWSLEKFTFLLLGHFIIDLFKSTLDDHPNWERDYKPDMSKYKIVDQIFHIIQLGVVLWIM